MTSKPLSFDRTYLFYLALLPSIGTAAFLYQVSIWEFLRLPVLILGVVALALYLATAVSYLVFPVSFWKRLWMVSNGPFWALVALLVWKQSIVYMLVITMLIDVGGASLAVLLVVLFKAPTRSDRLMGSVVSLLPLMLIVIAATLFLNSSHPQPLVPCLYVMGGIVQLGLSQRNLVQNDRVVREDSVVLLVGIITWVFVFIAGNALG